MPRRRSTVGVVPSLRVLLVDRERMLFDALAAWLRNETDVSVVVSHGSTREDLLRAIRRWRPDAVVASESVVEELEEVEALVVLALRDGAASAVRAARHGAAAWLPTTASAPEVVEAIRAAARGHAHYPPEHLGAVLRALRAGVPAPEDRPMDRLSDREREVLACLVEGRSGRAIAEQLDMSGHTVRTHIRNILRKFGVHSRLEAVSVARGEGQAGGERNASVVALGAHTRPSPKNRPSP